MNQLVLSLFPGIDMLGMAFEEGGFCVVRGPDVIFGGDIRRFHPTCDRFDGVIGGPPCQAFSELAKLVAHNGHKPRFGNLIPQFERCVIEAMPRWFLMENVKNAPDPEVAGFVVQQYDVRDSDLGGATMRRRRFWFGSRCKSQKPLAIQRKMRQSLFVERAVTGNSRVLTTGERIRNRDKIGTAGGPLPGAGKCTPLSEMCELQGLPEDFLKNNAFTKEATRQMIGNGVPLAMGRAIARAVREAIG